jgi:hypothetical protein
VEAGRAEAGLVVAFVAALDAVLVVVLADAALVEATLVEVGFAFALEVVAALVGLVAAAFAFSTFFASPETTF